MYARLQGRIKQRFPFLARSGFQLRNPNDLTLPEFFVMNGPDMKASFAKLGTRFRNEKGALPSTVTEFIKWIGIPIIRTAVSIKIKKRNTWG